jgi:hypothetical protein
LGKQKETRLNAQTGKRLLLIADVFIFAGVVCIGYLQSHHINAGFLTSYGADIIGPIWAYSGLRQLKIIKRDRPSPEFAAIFVFVACFLWEWSQRYDMSGTVLGITGGVFDPYDVLSYAGSLLGAYVVDKSFQIWANKRIERTP